MNSTLWHQQGNDFQASISGYKAIITEIPNKQTYAAHIESNEGKILREPFESFDDFAKAQAWVLFVVVDLEQLGDRAIAQKRMLETIHYCQSFLPESIHPSHVQRLNYLREWVVSRRDQENELGQLPTAQHSDYSLNWTERDSDTYTAETPYGQAILHEERSKKPFAFGTSSTYTISIQHMTGAIYKTLETFIDFVDAENWLQETLQKLDDPRIAEYYLDNIHFTLDICKHALPPAPEPLHAERLEYLNMLLDDALL
jgi:hypothetical protein